MKMLYLVFRFFAFFCNFLFFRKFFRNFLFFRDFLVFHDFFYFHGFRIFRDFCVFHDFRSVFPVFRSFFFAFFNFSNFLEIRIFRKIEFDNFEFEFQVGSVLQYKCHLLVHYQSQVEKDVEDLFKEVKGLCKECNDLRPMDFADFTRHFALDHDRIYNVVSAQVKNHLTIAFPGSDVIMR